MDAMTDTIAKDWLRKHLGPVMVDGKNLTEYVCFRLDDATMYERKWSELVETTAARIAQGEDSKGSDRSDRDGVRAPAHYTTGKMQVIEAMQALMTPEEFRGHLKGCVIKYLLRYPYKGDLARDLGKMLTYGTWLEQFETEGHITILPPKEKT